MPGTVLPRDLFQSIERGTSEFRYRGLRCLKNPFDLAIYSMLIWEVKPASIIELGSFCGGSALWLADTCAAQGLATHVYSFDVHRSNVVDPRIDFYRGDVRDLASCCPLDLINSLPRPLIVIEDTDHTHLSTLSTLTYFCPLMLPGEYVIVEDSIHGHLVSDSFKGDLGPKSAIDEFIATNLDDWEIDRAYCDWYGQNLTWCADGFLRRRGKERIIQVPVSNAGFGWEEMGLYVTCYDAEGNVKWRDRVAAQLTDDGSHGA